MSYDIWLFRTETKAKEQKLNDENFFDDDNNLEPFTEEQALVLKEWLLKYDYEQTEENEYGLNFFNEEHGVHVLFTDSALYFRADMNEDSIFEAGMTASEFTDTGEFEKYDPQNNGWEEV